MQRADLAAMLLSGLLAPPPYRWDCDRDECDGLPHDGNLARHARTKQRLPKGDWRTWLLLCGRGWGKTFTGSNAFLDMVVAHPLDRDGRPTEWLLAGPKYQDVIDLQLEGPSGLLHAMNARQVRFTYNKNAKRITLSTGQVIRFQHADGNDDLGRGGSWAGVWLDEMGMFAGKVRAAWDEALPAAMRAVLPCGCRPKLMVTTTPKAYRAEAFGILCELVDKGTREGSGVIVTRAPTWENADNINPRDLQQWREDYPEGTRVRRQEFDAELMRNVEGSLWTSEVLEAHRVLDAPSQLARKVLCIDPAVTSSDTSDHTGMVLVGAAYQDTLLESGTVEPRRHFYVLEDHSAKVPVEEWCRTALKVAMEHAADILVEVDQGGDLHERMLRTTAASMGIRDVPRILPVRAGSEGSKGTRAQPVASLYALGRCHHVKALPALEEQLTTWVPGMTKKSPDRLDALVHAVNELDGRIRTKRPADRPAVRRAW